MTPVGGENNPAPRGPRCEGEIEKEKSLCVTCLCATASSPPCVWCLLMLARGNAWLDVLRQPTAAIATQVGAVFQNPRSQLFHLRVADEVALGPSNLDLPESEIAERVDWALEAVGLSELRNRKPRSLLAVALFL